MFQCFYENKGLLLLKCRKITPQHCFNGTKGKTRGSASTYSVTGANRIIALRVFSITTVNSVKDMDVLLFRFTCLAVGFASTLWSRRQEQL